MEILSFITQSTDLIKEFDSFLKGYNKLHIGVQNEDTIYFINPQTGRNEIYLHFIPNNVEHEFSYNYSEEEERQIKHYIGNHGLILFDIQYRDELFLEELLTDFKSTIVQQYTFNHLICLLHHPHKGIIKFI